MPGLVPYEISAVVIPILQTSKLTFHKHVNSVRVLFCSLLYPQGLEPCPALSRFSENIC